MRVTHVTLRYPPASGGVEEYSQNIVERLRAAGDDVTVETTNLRTHHPATVLPDPPGDPPYVHRHSVRTLGPVAYPVPQSLRSSLASDPSAVIHAHGFWYAPADIAARVAQRRRIPFVLNPYYAPRTKAIWRLYRTFVGRRTIATADAVVVISPQEEEALRADGLPLRRVVLIPPGVDPREFLPKRENPFAARGIRSPHILFFAGRIVRAKGVDLLLQALPDVLRKFPDARLVLAGEDFGDQTSFAQLAERLGVSRAVTWLGKLPREELLAAYQHASAFLFPSRYEAFGIAVLEAQAAGRPVVAMNASALPFIVQHEKTGLLFQPEDSLDLAVQTNRLLKNPDLARRLGATARDRAHRSFTWDASVRKVRDLYVELTADKLHSYGTIGPVH